MPALSSQLEEDGVAFSNPDLAADEQVQAAIETVLKDSHGIAVVDVYPQRLADARDMAQELQDTTGLDTVIVQTTRNVSAVSDSYSRAALESAQGQIPQGVDQVTLLDEFYVSVNSTDSPWGLVISLVAITVIACAVTAFRSATHK